MADTGSTVAKRQLGMALRTLRLALHLDRDDAARELGCSVAKIGRIETGDVGVKATELDNLLRLYKVVDQEQEDLRRLGVETRRRRSRTSYGTAIPDWFRRYVNLEEGAEAIRFHATELVPGLLQTEEYARAVLLAGPFTPPGDVDRLVQARMARRKRIEGDSRVQVHAVLGEGVLRREVGGPTVLRRQLAYLRELADWPNVTLQVSAFSRGAHAAAGFTFTLLRLPNNDGLDIVYLEDPASARYVDNDPAEQTRYQIIWNHLTRSGALPAVSSAALLDTLVSEP